MCACTDRHAHCICVYTHESNTLILMEERERMKERLIMPQIGL